MRVSLLQELIEQRDYVAGRDGYVWVNRAPINPKETCAVVRCSNLSHVRGGTLSGRACDFLSDQTEVLIGERREIMVFNDHPSTTHQMVLDLFDLAIKEASREEAS